VRGPDARPRAPPLCTTSRPFIAPRPLRAAPPRAGHRVKSLSNPDKRVVLVKEFAFAHFPSTDVLKYALAVEAVTTQKKENLILNVDGAIAVAFVDLLRGCGAFTREEADEAIKSGALNGLFVVGRSIGFIGHFLDQVRLKQGLYRHPVDDITYMDNV
jgi:ATP citrate (pro-S)-lyase